MNKFLSILLIISSFIIVGCQPQFKDSFGSNRKKKGLNLKFKDSYGGISGRKSQLGFRDSYIGGSGRTRKLRFKDSYGGKAGRRSQLGFKDSYKGGTGRKNQHGFRDSYGSRTKGRKGQFGFKDSFGSSRSTKINRRHKKDAYGTNSRNGRRGYKDPEKKWWHIRGKQSRQGKPFGNRKGYDSSRAKHSIPKKKKKVKRSTKFEGMK